MKLWIKGVSCSGKSTLGYKLSKVLDIPLTMLDELYWLPGWQENSIENFTEKVQKILSNENWVIDGNYSKLNKVTKITPDYIIWLDYPFHTIIWRCMKRSFHRIVKQEIVCNGNKETLRAVFSTDSLFLWIIKTYWKRKKDLTDLLKNEKNIIVIRSEKDIEKMLSFLKEKIIT